MRVYIDTSGSVSIGICNSIQLCAERLLCAPPSTKMTLRRVVRTSSSLTARSLCQPGGGGFLSSFSGDGSDALVIWYDP